MGILDELLKEIVPDVPDFGGAGRDVQNIGGFIQNFFTDPSDPSGPAKRGSQTEGMTPEERLKWLEEQAAKIAAKDPFQYDAQGNLTGTGGLAPVLQYLAYSDPEDVRELQESLLSNEKETGIPASVQALLFSGDPRGEAIAESLGIDPGNLGGPNTGTDGGIFQSGEDVILPPLVALLQEMSTRTNNDRTAASNQITSAKDIAGALAPGGSDQDQFFPGGAPGGLMDIFGGILSGQGAKGIANGNDPFSGMRKPGVLPIEIQELLGRVGAPGPSITQDVPEGLDIAKRIFESALKIPRFSSSGGSFGGGDSGEIDIDSYISGLL